jgi:hypothetical protein
MQRMHPARCSRPNMTQMAQPTQQTETPRHNQVLRRFLQLVKLLLPLKGDC